MGFDFRIGGEAQQSYAFSTAQTAATSEAEEDSTRLTMGKSSDGDTVSISAEGKDMLAAMQSGTAEKSEKSSESGTESTSSTEDLIDRVKEQIEKLQQEIEKLQQEPEKNKEQISAKQNELLQLQGQLMELQSQQNEASGMSSTGGTRANGMSSSLT